MVCVWVAEAPESAKMEIRDWFLKESCKGYFVLNGFGGEKVNDMSSNIKSFDPKGGRKLSLKQKATNRIVYCSNHALRFAVLLRAVGTREPKRDPLRGKEVVKLGVIVFTTVITLQKFDSFLEVVLNIV